MIPAPLEALQALDVLTPAGIAHFLTRQGMRGVPFSPVFCPLARFLSERYHTQFYVFPTRVYNADDNGLIFLATSEEMDKLRNVRAFLNQFDKGRYPLLLDGPMEDTRNATT